MRLILASGSETRKKIFDLIGWKYEIIKSMVEEKSNKTKPDEYVVDLSRQKAESVALNIEGQAIIVSADTIIYMDGKIYEKPKNKEEAFNNIKEMIGKTIYAVTGITIKDLYKSKEISFSDSAEVIFKKDINDDDINWYINNEELILNQSGFTLLGKGVIFIDEIKGDYNTIWGISPSKLNDKFKELGYKMSDFELK